MNYEENVRNIAKEMAKEIYGSGWDWSDAPVDGCMPYAVISVRRESEQFEAGYKAALIQLHALHPTYSVTCHQEQIKLGLIKPKTAPANRDK